MAKTSRLKEVIKHYLMNGLTFIRESRSRTGRNMEMLLGP